MDRQGCWDVQLGQSLKMEIIQGKNTGGDAGNAEDQEEARSKEGVCLEKIR